MRKGQKKYEFVKSCKPPVDCFNCPLPDCKCYTKPTPEETKFSEVAGLAKGRPGRNYNFLLVDDVKYRVRGGKMIEINQKIREKIFGKSNC